MDVEEGVLARPLPSGPHPPATLAGETDSAAGPLPHSGGQPGVELRRTSSAQDTAQLRALYNSAFPIQYGDSFYESLLLGSYNGKPLLSMEAFADEQLIGAVSASFDSSEQILVDSPREAVYILTLAVAPAWRRRGVAAVLMKAVEEWAFQQPNVDALYLHVLTTNADAISFYKRLGFVNFKREVGFYPIKDTLEDAFLYVRYRTGAQQKQSAPESFLQRIFGMLYRAVVKLVLFTSPQEHEEEESSLV